MNEFLVDNIYVRFGGQLFRQMVGIPMETNCAPLSADLFLCSYENEFLDKLIKEGKRKLARKFKVEPYLRYCNTTWGYCAATLLNRLQALQNRAVRVIKGLQYDEADHPKILRELGILNVEQLVRLDTASLVYHIENNLAPEQFRLFHKM